MPDVDDQLAELAEFAARLVPPAADVLSTGYADVVARFRNDSALGRRAAALGIDTAVGGDDPALLALQKSNKELVTTAERVAEGRARVTVRHRYPDHAVVGEELGAEPGALAGNDWIWVFDPVDGTSAMIRHAMAEAYGIPLPEPSPSFGFTVGVVHGDQAVIGVVAELQPRGGGLAVANTWTGVAGARTTVNGAPVGSLPRVETLAAATLTSTVPEVMFRTREAWGEFQALRDGTAAFISDQNCVGFMRLLGGGVDVVAEADLMLPDAAALVAPLTGAGITVTDLRGEPLNFGVDGRAAEYRLLCAVPTLHEQALAVMRRGTPDAGNTFEDGSGSHRGYALKFPGASPPGP